MEAAHQDHLIDLDTLQQEMGEEITQQTLSQQESLAIMRNRNIRTQLITNKITEMATQKQRL